MKLEDLFMPLPVGRPGRHVQPMGPNDISLEEEQRLRRAEASARYRESNREAVNQRVADWRLRQRESQQHPTAKRTLP